MIQKKPDLIDKYMYICISAYCICFWSFMTILGTVILWSYFLVGCIDLYYETFTIIDFVTSGVVFILWFFSMALLVCSMRKFSEAHHIFMES